MAYDKLRRDLTIDKNERSKYVNDFLRMISTQNAAQINRASDAATHAGASQGAKNALASGMAYESGRAAEGGYNTLNKSIDDTNRRANEYIQQLIEQDKARRTQLWSDIGLGVGQLAGYALAGPLGGLTAKTIAKPAANPTSGMSLSPSFSNDFSEFSAKNWYNKGNNKTADFSGDYPMPRRF